MIRVLTIKRKGIATISTRGLRRVVIQPEGKIVDELVPLADAKVYVDSFNACNPSGKFRAEIQKYPQLAK
jgi:hypothetical protein